MIEEQLCKIMLWGFGTCVSGFLFLSGWMWWMVGKLHDKVSYEWLENNFQVDINKKIDLMNQTLCEIKQALVGGFDTKGLITKVLEIEERCKRQHD